MSEKKVYSECRAYLLSKYEEIMSLYSAIYTQIESELSELSNQEKTAVAAYYTVVSHKTLDNFPIISKIEKAINQNLDRHLTEMENELAIAILVESRIHELEKRGFAQVIRQEDGTTEILLTEKGKLASEKIGEDIRKSDKFDPTKP